MSIKTCQKNKHKYIGRFKAETMQHPIEFELDDEFENLSGKEKDKSLINSLWESGFLDVWYEKIKGN